MTSLKARGQKRGTTVFDYLIHGLFMTTYGFVKYLPPPLGNWLRFGVVWPFMKKCDGVRVGEGVTIWYPYRISIGSNTTLNEFVNINGFGGIEIGKNVRIGHNTSILSSDHVTDDTQIPIKDQGLWAAPTCIEDDVLIGAHVLILKGVTIGCGAVVGAGSVVTKSIDSKAIVAGNPARVIKTRG